MASTIKIKRSTTANAVPATLESGEVAINEADAKLFTRKSSDGTVRTTDLAHETRSDNPHGTTAAQVGAYTQAAVDVALAGKAPLNHNHAIAHVAGLQSALDDKASKLGQAFTGDVHAPNFNATSGLKKAGVAGQIITKITDAVWSTGYTTTSTGASEAWASAQVVKAAAQSDAASLLLAVTGYCISSRSAAITGLVATLEVRTHDGAAWSDWSQVATKILRIYSGGAGTTEIDGDLTFMTTIALAAKTQWQARLTLAVQASGSSPSATLSRVEMRGIEVL